MQLFFMFVMMVVSIVIAYVMRPKPTSPKPASLDDFGVPRAEEGYPTPVIFGRVLAQSPNIVWYGDLGYKEVKSEGGK